jgi:excisionase family DNA binding protein
VIHHYRTRWRNTAVLTVKKAADQLGVSAALVYALCAARELRHVRVGLRRGRVLIPEDAIGEYASRRTVTVRETAPPAPAFKH